MSARRSMSSPTSAYTDPMRCADCGHHKHAHKPECHPLPSSEQPGERLCPCNRFVSQVR